MTLPPAWRSRLLELVAGLDLDAEMIEAGRAPARRDREIHAGIFEHPFGVVGFHDRGLACEQGRVETDGVRKIVDRYVNVQTLHGLSFQAGTLLRFRADLEAGAGAHEAPPQQFSVRKPTSAFMVSNRAA